MVDAPGSLAGGRSVITTPARGMGRKPEPSRAMGARGIFGQKEIKNARDGVRTLGRLEIRPALYR